MQAAGERDSRAGSRPAASGWTMVQSAQGATETIAMQMILFTVLGIGLYLLADRLLDGIEARAGRRFEYRSLIFFALLLALAVVSFAVVRRFVPGG
jgi:NhaP-type Na+/H+ or K+/H+ antiporter